MAKHRCSLRDEGDTHFSSARPAADTLAPTGPPCQAGEQCQAATPRQNHDCWQAIVADAPDIILRLDRQGTITSANRGLSPELPPAALLGQPLREWILPDDHGALRAALAGVCAASQPRRVNLRGRGPGVAERCFSCNIGPVFNTGEIDGLIVIARDVTHEQTMATRLRRAQKMEAVGTLAAGAAHDFSNVLLAICTHADLVRPHANHHQALWALDRIRESAQQAAQMAQAVLTFSRKDMSRKLPIDLGTLVRKSVLLLRACLPTRIEVASDVPAEPVLVRADETQLQQVLMNLAVNARDAMPLGGHLRITVRQEQQEVRTGDPTAAAQVALLVVEDSGTGMSDAVRARLFDEFFTTKPPGHGTGLGLPIVHEIVREHGGSIDVHSSPGSGSRFTLTFPAIHATPELAKPATHGRLASGVSSRVVVAEDDDQVRAILAAALRSAGCHVIQAIDGEAALAAVAALGTGPELVVLDVNLPKRHGLSCATELQRTHPALPVIMITGDSAFCLPDTLSNVALLINKPFRISDLAATVRRVLQSARPAPTGSDGSDENTAG
jgi:signal transduction histidine kinase